DKFHRDEHGARVLAEIVNGDDIRVIQPPCRLRFALEARDCVRRLRTLDLIATDGLDRNGTLDRRIEGFVDDTHRTAAELAADFVLPQPGRVFAHYCNEVPAKRLLTGAHLYLLSISQTFFCIRRCTMVSSPTPP